MSQIPTVRSKVAAQWAAQLATDGVTGVDVREFDPHDEDTLVDRAWILRVSANQDQASFGRRTEDVTVDGMIRVTRAGAGDTKAAESEDRAFTILASLETSLVSDFTVDSAGIFGQISQIDSTLEVTPSGMTCVVEFTVDVDVNL